MIYTSTVFYNNTLIGTSPTNSTKPFRETVVNHECSSSTKIAHLSTPQRPAQQNTLIYEQNCCTQSLLVCLFFCICYINTSVFPNTIDFIFVFAGVRWCGNRRASHFLHLTWGLIYRCDDNHHHHRNYHHYCRSHPPHMGTHLQVYIVFLIIIMIVGIFIIIVIMIIISIFIIVLLVQTLSSLLSSWSSSPSSFLSFILSSSASS